MEFKRSVRSIVTDAREMGVEADWSHAFIQIGNDYDEMQTLVEVVARRAPTLEISVPAERIKE